MMKVELTKQARAAAVGSVQRYFEENFPEPIGNLPAGLLLDFFVEEVGPVIYNKAILDAQARMQQHIVDKSVQISEIILFRFGKKYTTPLDSE